MRSKYQDKFGLWHDKANRRSNNWMIYTAYAKALGLEYGDIQGYFDQCVVKMNRDNITINRHPNKKTPPLSFDEALGASYLGLLSYDILKANHFVYYGHGERLDSSIFARLVLALAEAMAPRIIMRGLSITVKKPNLNDRNNWWKRKLENVRYFAARMTPAHTYVVKKFNKKKPHKEEEKLWAFYRDNVTKTKANTHQKRSTRNLLWLLLIMNGDHGRAKKLKPWQSFEGYFGRDHDFTIAIKKKYGVK